MNKFILSVAGDAARGLPIYFNSLCEKFDQSDTTRAPGAQDFHQILLVTEGAGTFECEGASYSLHSGCAFFTRNGTPCSYTRDGSLTTAFLTVRGEAIDALVDFYGYGSYIFVENTDVEHYTSMIRNIEAEYDGYRRDAVLSAMCYSFFCDFFERTRNVTPIPTDEVTLYIERSYTQRLTLDKLAKISGSSVSKLCHDFKRRHGITVFQYILDLRLSYARELIRNSPEATTQAVAIASGFDDVSYFCKAYKKKFAKTPMQDKLK